MKSVKFFYNKALALCFLAAICFVFRVFCAEVVPRSEIKYYPASLQKYITKMANEYTVDQGSVAQIYSNGLSVPINRVELIERYKLAAARGDVDAQYQLADAYRSGEILRQNLVEAARLFNLAASQGHSSAQFNLGIMRQYGYGLQRNYMLAFMWYQLA